MFEDCFSFLREENINTLVMNEGTGCLNRRKFSRAWSPFSRGLMTSLILSGESEKEAIVSHSVDSSTRERTLFLVFHRIYEISLIRHRRLLLYTVRLLDVSHLCERLDDTQVLISVTDERGSRHQNFLKTVLQYPQKIENCKFHLRITCQWWDVVERSMKMMIVSVW